MTDLVSIPLDESSSNGDESVLEDAFAQSERIAVLDPRDVSVIPPATNPARPWGQAEIRAGAAIQTPNFLKPDPPVVGGAVQIVDAEEELEELLTQFG